MNKLQKQNDNVRMTYKAAIETKNYKEYERIEDDLTISQKFEILNKIESENHINAVETEKILKRLVERNIEIVYNELYDICLESPISVIDAFIENILVSNTIQFLLEKLVSMFPRFFQEIFYFHTLQKYRNYDNLTNGVFFTKSFLNFTNFLLTYRKIDVEPINQFIVEQLTSKNYIYIILIEKTVVKNSEMAQICKKHFVKAYTENFNTLKVEEKLKIDICDRYYCLCNSLYGKRKSLNRPNDFSGLMQCYPSEIAEFADQFDLKKILDEFYAFQGDDFFTVRSIILFLRSRNDFCDITIIEKMEKYLKSNKEDLRLLVNSFIALIKNKAKQNKMTEVGAGQSSKFNTKEYSEKKPYTSATGKYTSASDANSQYESYNKNMYIDKHSDNNRKDHINNAKHHNKTRELTSYQYENTYDTKPYDTYYNRPYNKYQYANYHNNQLNENSDTHIIHHNNSQRATYSDTAGNRTHQAYYSNIYKRHYNNDNNPYKNCYLSHNNYTQNHIAEQRTHQVHHNNIHKVRYNNTVEQETRYENHPNGYNSNYDTSILGCSVNNSSPRKHYNFVDYNELKRYKDQQQNIVVPKNPSRQLDNYISDHYKPYYNQHAHHNNFDIYQKNYYNAYKQKYQHGQNYSDIYKTQDNENNIQDAQKNYKYNRNYKNQDK